MISVFETKRFSVWSCKDLTTEIRPLNAKEVIKTMKYIDRYVCYLQLGWHPVAVVKCTFTQTIHKITQLICKECGLCPIFASYTQTFALQLRKNTEKLSHYIITHFINSGKLWLCSFMKINKDGNERRVLAVKMFKIRILTIFKQK